MVVYSDENTTDGVVYGFFSEYKPFETEFVFGFDRI